jgi:translocation and assembly module TamB
VKKRHVAVAFLAMVLALLAGSLAALRTRWAGDRICGLAAARLSAAVGQPVTFDGCLVDPLRVEIEVEGVRVGPADRPVLAADAIAARLTPVQALGGTVQLASLRLVRPRVVAIIPAGSGGGACPPAFLDAFEVRTLEVEDGGLDLVLPGGARVTAPRVDVRSDTGGPRDRLRALAAGARAVDLRLEAGDVRVEAGGRAFSVSGLRAAGELALDLSGARIGEISAEVGGVRLSVTGTLEDLCRPAADLAATADGPAASLAGLAGHREERWSGSASVQVRASGPVRSPALSGSVRFERLGFDGIGPFDGTADLALEGERLVFRRVGVALGQGEAEIRGAVRLQADLPADLEADLRSVDLAEVLARVTVPDAWVSMRMEGRAALSGTLHPVALVGEIGADLRDLRVLPESHRTYPAGAPPIVHMRRGRIDGPVRVDRTGLLFEPARVAAGEGVAEMTARVGFETAAGFQVRLQGTADLDALGHLAEIPLGGMATVQATVGAAPYGDPRVTGRARAERLRYLDLDLGTAAADLDYQDGILRFGGIEGVRGASRYQGDLTVDLAAAPVRVTALRVEARGRLRDLWDAAWDYAPAARLVRDVMDGDVEIQATAGGPAIALDAEFDARLGTGRLFGRRYASGRVTGRVRAGEEAIFDRAELRPGSGAVRARGRWGMLLPFPWELDVEWEGVPLADLDLPAGPWGGSASGTAVLRGSTERPAVSFAGNGDGVTLRGVPLGTVQAGGTLSDGKLVVTGTAEGLRFSGEAATAGRMPYRARAEIALDDAGRLFVGGPGASLRSRVEGVVEVEGHLAEPAAARGSATIARLTVGYADFRVESTGPVTIALDRGRIDVRPLTLRGTNTELSLGGSREASGRLDLSASGRVDLRLLGGLFPFVKRPQGTLALEAHVGGIAAEPMLVGAGRVEDAGFALRDAAVVVSGVRGDLAFSQNRVLFDDLAGALNGGRLALRGEVELAHLAPARLRIEALLEDAPLAVPASLPATLSGRVVADGTPQATTVAGLLHVVRARYAEDVGLEKRLLDIGGRPPPPPRPYDPTAEWLKFDVRVAVDGDARIDNDLVRGGVRGDLTLTGTLASPGLVGTLTMTDGSRAFFRGNEFLLSRALVTFDDRHRIAGTLDVTGDAQVRDYVVHMHLFNSLDDPRLQLTSDPALSEQDIVTLLSLGFTRREVAAGDTAVTGAATAAAAQALFAASGLDEQVKRFLPPGGVVRDIDLRFTSGWSEATGQVEPRAEVESWLLKDRLRLRFQSPLSGARGQKVQAEMRLGGNTSLQYQWDNENAEVQSSGDHGIDLKLRWEWDD